MFSLVSLPKTNKRGLIKLIRFCIAKESINKRKRSPTEWKKIFANDVTNKSLISKIHKQLTQLINRKKKKQQQPPIKIWAEIYMEFRKMVTMTLYARQQETQMCTTVFWTLWERERVGWFGKMALKHVEYHIWNESPVQVRCMIQYAQGWCTGMTQRDGMGRKVGGGSGWGTHVHPWLIHVNVWQKPLQCCKVISRQLKQIN